jgi:hypothetical protein
LAFVPFGAYLSGIVAGGSQVTTAKIFSQKEPLKKKGGGQILTNWENLNSACFSFWVTIGLHLSPLAWATLTIYGAISAELVLSKQMEA